MSNFDLYKFVFIIDIVVVKSLDFDVLILELSCLDIFKLKPFWDTVITKLLQSSVFFQYFFNHMLQITATLLRKECGKVCI